MDLTDKDLASIKEAAKTVEYGSVTIHISAVSKHLDLEIRRRLRGNDEPDGKKIKVLSEKN